MPNPSSETNDRSMMSVCHGGRAVALTRKAITRGRTDHFAADVT